mmetsp:Transcript_19416/g.53312  ORF Transcript_19416/g.53312 Transcript_19416/m.53312 type:complete len:256 (+) Transcript_19416:415-1182(+)
MESAQVDEAIDAKYDHKSDGQERPQVEAGPTFRMIAQEPPHPPAHVNGCPAVHCKRQGYHRVANPVRVDEIASPRRDDVQVGDHDGPCNVCPRHGKCALPSQCQQYWYIDKPLRIKDGVHRRVLVSPNRCVMSIPRRGAEAHDHVLGKEHCERDAKKGRGMKHCAQMADDVPCLADTLVRQHHRRQLVEKDGAKACRSTGVPHVGRLFRNLGTLWRSRAQRRAQHGKHDEHRCRRDCSPPGRVGENGGIGCVIDR